MIEKTCGSCEWYYEVRPISKQGTCSCTELNEDGCAVLIHAEDPACDNYDARPLTFDQRYEQLEQVAENLFHSFCFYCKHDEIIKSYRTLLEDLGVNLDD